jgi:SHS family lactate transporter-like MFS transporter
MEFLGHFRRLTPLQRNTFTACFLGWSLDAFDFFILTFCVSAIATQFQTKISAVAEAIFITLAFRPVGAFLFGLMADRFGRRPTLMVDIIAYSVFELASAFAPSLKVFLIMRALFGIAIAGRLFRGLFDGRSGLWDGVPLCRLARNVRDRRPACVSGHIHSHQSG